MARVLGMVFVALLLVLWVGAHGAGLVVIAIGAATFFGAPLLWVRGWRGLGREYAKEECGTAGCLGRKVLCGLSAAVALFGGVAGFLWLRQSHLANPYGLHHPGNPYASLLFALVAGIVAGAVALHFFRGGRAQAEREHEATQFSATQAEGAKPR